MKIIGKVVDASSGSPLPGASISLSSNDTVGTVSDSGGNFSIDVPDGS